MSLSQYRLDEKLLTIFDHLTDEQKIETAIQEYSIDDILRIFTYYELEQYPYAKNVFLEKYRNNPYALFCYSRDMICGRWLEAEPIIMTNAHCAYVYSRIVIRGRWPEAELTIMTNAQYTCYYACHIIKGRWPEVEPTIMTSPAYAYFYSRDVIKGRWPEAEPAIMKQYSYWRLYKNRFNL